MANANDGKQEKRKILHRIGNCLAPLQTFLDVIDTSKEDPKLRSFHQLCRENFVQLKELLKKLDGF